MHRKHTHTHTLTYTRTHRYQEISEYKRGEGDRRQQQHIHGRVYSPAKLFVSVRDLPLPVRLFAVFAVLRAIGQRILR